MARQYRRERVRFVVDEPVEVEDGVMLPAGEYPGLMEQHGYDGLDGVSWAPPEYKIEVSAKKWGEMGGKVERDLVSTVIDLSRQVMSGKVEVEGD